MRKGGTVYTELSHKLKISSVIKEISCTSNSGKNYTPGKLFYPLLVWF